MLKVKVGNKIHSSEKEPIMIILTEADKENIKNMKDTVTKYCVYPDNYTPEQIQEFMVEEDLTQEETW